MGKGEWVSHERDFLASSPTLCRREAVSSERLNYQLPHAMDGADSLVQAMCTRKAAVTIFLSKKTQTKALKQISENQCRLNVLLKQSSQSCSDFIFETSMAIIQIDPKGSPVLCLTWMDGGTQWGSNVFHRNRVIYATQRFPQEMNTQFDFYGGNRAGCSQDDIV